MLYLVAFARKALGAREKEGLDNVILGDEFWCLASGYPANECKPESLVGERVPFLFVISATGTRRRKPTRLTVCFFVSCNRHCFPCLSPRDSGSGTTVTGGGGGMGARRIRPERGLARV